MRICAVTGSRADWGLLRPVLQRLRSAGHPPTLIVTGSHLSDRFDSTASQIEADGFVIDHRVPLPLERDDSGAIAAAIGAALTGISTVLEGEHPDLLLILGDRYEIFAAAQAALVCRIPVAHIAGGDISEGAYDDAIRHAISKLSHLHFTTNEAARRRVLQLGEAPERVINAGSPGIDALRQTPRWTRQQLEQRLGMPLRARNLAVTFHAATLDTRTPQAQLQPLLDALAALDEDIGIVFTGSNADSGGLAITQLIRDFSASREHSCFVASLGQAGYYSLVAAADLVVGNSSSGLYEAPSLGTATLDIGIRQQGRLRGPSVRHVDNDRQAIHDAIIDLLAQPPEDLSNPYGDGDASRRIVDALLDVHDPGTLLIKHFVEVPPQ
jgi:UDP-hydrolysing UDP-N-acetyl-D-glucosamine 2-epimerase